MKHKYHLRGEINILHRKIITSSRVWYTTSRVWYNFWYKSGKTRWKNYG